MSEADLWKAVSALEIAALECAKGSGIDPAVVGSHLSAISEGRRVMSVAITRSGHRTAIAVTTLPPDATHESEIFPLFAAKARSD